MNFSYKIEHDFGLAPNPFWGYCTLAVCKSQIRNNSELEIGSWIFGTGSKKLNKENHLIYAMKVEEKITFNEYWNDPRFQCKKPVLNGPLKVMYGDNIYHQNSGKWIQEDSAHSLIDKTNTEHLTRDTGGKYVLISKNFFYFGNKAIPIPEKFVSEIPCKGRNFCSKQLKDHTIEDFVNWLNNKYTPGIIYGDPINWPQNI